MANFPLLEDANSIKITVMHVVHLLGSGKIDTKVAGLMLYAVQTASINMKRVNFEAAKVTDVVIDQDTLDLTCLNGPQWFDRDFKENAGEQREAAQARGELGGAADRAKLRKKPDPLTDSPDMNDSLAGILLQHLGLVTETGATVDADETTHVIESQPFRHGHLIR